MVDLKHIFEYYIYNIPLVIRSNITFSRSRIHRLRGMTTVAKWGTWKWKLRAYIKEWLIAGLIITSIKPKHQGFVFRVSHGLIEPIKKSPSIVFINCDVAGVVSEIYLRLARQIKLVTRSLFLMWFCCYPTTGAADTRVSRQKAIQIVKDNGLSDKGFGKGKTTNCCYRQIRFNALWFTCSIDITKETILITVANDFFRHEKRSSSNDELKSLSDAGKSYSFLLVRF